MSRRLTDEEIAERYSQQYRVETPGAGLSELGGSAVDRFQAKAFGMAEPFGLSRDYRLAQEAEANRTAQRYYDTNQEAVGSFRNISGVGDVGRYAAELGVQTLPELVPIVGAGLIGGPAAAYGVAGLSGIGEVMQAQREQAGRTDLTAIPLGLAYGGVEAATGIVGKLAGTGVRAERAASAANRYLDNLGGFTGGAARTGAAFGRTGFSEALGEVGQQYISNVGRLAIDPRVELFSPEAMDDYAESFVGGGLLGGLVGGAAGGWRRSQGFRDAARERDLTSTAQDQEPLAQRPLESQFVTQDQTVGLQSFINQNVGVTRPKRKDYVSQFKAAYDEPTGQFVNDPETGIERPLTVGEALQRSQAALDLTQEKPAETAAAAQVMASVATTRDPKDVFIRDELKVIPNSFSRKLFDVMAESGVDPKSAVMVPVWNFAGEKYMSEKRYNKALELMDEALINASKEAASGTGVSTVQQPAGGVGVGGAVVQGSVGDAGPAAPVAGTMVRSPAVAGGALQQAGVLPVAPGQPSTTVTTGAPSGTQAPQTIQTAPQGQTPAAITDAAPVKANTTLRLNKQEAVEDQDAALANYVEIARETGNTAGLDATLADAAGKRQDQKEFTKEDLDAIIEEQVGKGKNKDRDRKILRAYILARKAAQGERVKTSEKVGAAFGIQGSRVRQIGNPEKLADIAVSMGFDRNQVFTELGIESTTEGAVDLTQAQESVDGEVDAEAAVDDTAEGDVDANADDSRYWQKSSTAGSDTAVKFVKLADAIDELKATKAELTQLGVVEAAQSVQTRIDELSAKLDTLMAEAAAKDAPKAAPVSKAPATVKEAQQRWKDAGRDITKLSSEDLGLLLPYVRDTIKNTELAGKITAELQSRGDTNAVQVESPAGVSVQPKADSSKKDGGQVRRAPKPAEKSQAPAQVLTDSEQAAQAWDKVASTYPAAPKFADLTDAQRKTFIEFGPDNWTENDVEIELAKLVKAELGFTRMSRRSVRTTDQDGVDFESVEASLEDLSGYSDGIAAGIRGLRSSGMGNAVDAIDSWMVTFSPVKWDAIYTMMNGKRTIVYNGLILKDKELSTIATLHEVGHGIDEVQGGLGKFSGDREFKMSKVNGEPMAMRPGTVADEVLTYFEDNSDTTALGYMLNYPLDMSDKLNRALTAQELREEVFAQVWAFSNMNGGMDFLRANLPTTHAFMEKVHEQVKATNYAATQGAQQGAQSGQVQAGQQGAQPAGAVSRAARQRQSLIDRDQRFEGLPDAKDPTIDGPTPKGATNIDRAIRLMERAAKAKDPEIAAQLKAEADKLLAGAARGLASGDGRIKFSRASRQRQGLIDRNIAKLPKMAQQPVRNTVGALGDLGGKGLDYAVFTSDLVKRAVAAGMPSAQKFADVLARRASRVSELEREIEKIADGYANIEQQFKGSARGSVNDFLFESTRTGKWGYGKYRDPKMGAAFDALGPKAQKFVKDVFAHGDKMLADKKKVVIDAATSEYDAMIKEAQALVNVTTDEEALKKAKENLAALKAEKVASLKRFQTLFRLREGMPYAPIKRNGTHVVIGKSKEYMAAVKANDTKRVKELESDPDHYHVSFADSKWEARSLKDRLEEQGAFDELNLVTRSEAFEEAFSGEALLPALTKMRAAVDKRVGADPTAGKMLGIINQLYLEALAEGSARKSEMRRRGIAGEVDMLQSFTQQGRADANFMANVQFEPLVQDQLQNMRNESRSGDRERKSELFNELTQRYADSLDVKVNTWVSGLTNLASKFFLASSPAYYLQNLTQPFMMSLPAMAGRHDYTKAAAEMVKAYTELGPLFKDVKLFDQQFDFSKVPADVRTAINDLVNQGKIDIGLATEINEYKVDADGNLGQFAQRLNKGMRMAVQKTEAVNRLSTAIAAYRLEFAKTKDAAKATQYAADILTDTHGDYTAFNAPRVFNTQWGKIALQFRKFQLIQIAFFYKLFRDAFTNPKERAAALKTLAYSLSHTAVFAGVMGLPGYAAVSAILSAFGDEDEPFDLTAWSREQLGPEWADMIMRGAPTVVGMDLSGKIGAGNMLSIMPFSNADLATNAGRAEALGTLMGGASFGMASRMADGLLLMADGDYYKGLERVMPKGVSDALKSGRQATEGMTRRNGDVILPDSEVSALGTVWTAMGVPSVQQAVTYERQNRMRDITENFQDRSKRIKNDYAKAVRQKDTAAMQEAREAWTKLQQTRQRNGLKPQPVSDLLKAPQQQAQREQRTVGGVQYRKDQRQLAEDVVAN